MDRLWSREQILNMIKIYGATKETIEKIVNEAIKNVGEKINLLWSNEDYLDEFPKSSINLLKINKYNKFIIFYKNSYNDNEITSKIIYVNNGETNYTKLDLQLIFISDNIYYRNITINTLMGSFDFDDCIYNDYRNSTSETEDTYLIPYFICGIN